MTAKKKKFEYYYDQFLRGVLLTRNVEYGNRKDIQRNNRGVRNYRNAARCIGKFFPDKISTFAMLLDDEQKDIREASAVSVLTLMDADKPAREKALAIIRDLAENGSPLEIAAWSMWMKKHGTGDGSASQSDG